MTDHLLVEIGYADHAAHEQDTANVSLNIVDIGAGVGQPQHSRVSIPKGSLIERDRECSREKKEHLRENTLITSGGSISVARRCCGSLRGSSKVL